MELLIIGGDSSIGKCYINFCKDNLINFEYTSRKKNSSDKALFLDLKDPDFKVFNKKQFDFTIFFASIASIDFCENNKKESYLVNVENTQKTLYEVSKVSKRVLFISSNCVFDGKKPFMTVNDKTNPSNEYGRQKLEVEKWMRLNLSNAAILRLSKVIHPYFDLIIEWKKKLDLGIEIYPLDDKYFAPTPIESVIKKIEEIRISDKNELFHCTSSKDLSYYEYALRTFDSHVNKKLVKKSKLLNSIGEEIKTFSSLK